MAGNLSKSDDGEIYINGGTDGTLIGNVDDRLKVTTDIGPESSSLFGRLRVSNSSVVFTSSFRNGDNTAIWDRVVSDGGTITADMNIDSLKLNTTSTTNSKVEIRTFRNFSYTPGRDVTAYFTGNFIAATSGVTKRFGYFDDLDGIFFDYNGSNMGVVLRSSTSGSAIDSRISQASWNVDKLDGTGLSGLTFDITKQTLFFIEYAWLGSGVIQIGMYIGQSRIVCHRFTSSNLITTPWAQVGSYPFTASIQNISGNTAAQLNITCVAVLIDGNTITNNIDAQPFDINSGLTEKTITNETPLFSLRMRSASNRSTIVPFNLNLIMTSGTKFIFWEIVKDGTLTGASWANAGSISQVDTSTTSVTGGMVVQSGYIVVSGSTTVSSDTFLANSLLYLGRYISGTSNTLTLRVSTSGGSAKLVYESTIMEFLA